MFPIIFVIFEASTLLNLIASLVAAIAIVWAAWVGFGQFESWAGRGSTLLDASFYIGRGLVLLLLLLFFIR